MNRNIFKIIVTDNPESESVTKEKIIRNNLKGNIIFKKLQVKDVTEIKDELIDSEVIINYYAKIEKR